MANYTAEGTFLPDYNKGDESKLDIDLLRRKYTARINNLYNPQLEGGIQIDKRLNIDPRVLYRWVGGQAIKDFDETGIIRGPETGGYAEETVKGQQPPFFSQGMPLWQYAGGIKAGTGTANSSENPYLIGTVGADWTGRLGNRTVDSSQISQSNFQDYLEQDRGLTHPIRGSLVDAQKELKKLERDVDDLRGSKGTPTTKQIDSFNKRYQTILGEMQPHQDAINRYLVGSDPMDEMYDGVTPLDSLRDSIGHHTGVVNFDLTPEQEWIKEKGTQRQLNELANVLTLRRDELKRLSFDFEPEVSHFNLTPRPYELFNGGKSTRFILPNWLKSQDRSTELIPSDSAIFERIKNGTATPEELNAVYGMGRFDYDLNDMGNPLRHLDLRRSGTGAMYQERLPSTRIEPSNAGYAEGWEIPSAFLDTKDRPFAVWQYTKGGLRLVNQGNNKPVLGNKPIPTELQDPYLTYMDLSESKARMAPDLASQKGKIRIEKFAQPDSVFSLTNVIDESTRGSSAYGRKGMVSTDLLTSPLKPFASVAQGLTEEDAFLKMMQKGLSSPDTARNFANNYIQNASTRGMVNAEMGASALKFAGKAGGAVAIGVTPFDALNRRERNFTDFYARTGRDPTYAENMMLRAKSGLEPALNFATFGAYDALAETPTYQAYLNQEQKDRAPAMLRQQSIDYPMVGGYQVERTTR